MHKSRLFLTASSARHRESGTNLDGTLSGCSTPMESRARLIEIKPLLVAVAGEVSKLPLLPSHRTSGPPAATLRHEVNSKIGRREHAS